MEYEIEDIRTNFENLYVKFKNIDSWVYFNPKELIGLMVQGIIKQKTTRTWFIGDKK